MKKAKCRLCGYIMKNVPKSWADVCYDCAENEEEIRDNISNIVERAKAAEKEQDTD